jgi:two-component sensor histidine kinase
MQLTEKIQKYIAAFIIVLMLAEPHVANAQVQPNYIQYLTDKGLQSNSIYNLHVAKNGLLYIAHSKGLSSFDGNHFTNYYHKERPFTEVTNIMETDDGDIFCKAFNNVLFRKIGDSLRWFTSIIPYSFGFASSAAYKNDIYSITNDSIIVFNAKTNTRTGVALNTAKVMQGNSAVKFIAPSLYNNTAAVFVINQNKTVCRLSQKVSFNIHFNNGDVFFIENKSVGSINYYTENEAISIQPLAKNSTVNYISTTDSAIWICTTNGLYYRNKYNKGGKFTYMFSGFDISDVKQTNEGNYFVSTIGQGLLFVPSFNVNILSSLPQNITCIAGKNNNLFLGCKDGNVLEYDLSQNSITKTYNNNKTAVKFILQNIADETKFITRNITQVGSKTIPFLIKDYCVLNNNIIFATNGGMYLYQNVPDKHWVNKYIVAGAATDGKLKKLSFSNEHTSTIKYNRFTDKFYINNYSGILEMANGYKDAQKMPEPNCVLKDMCVWNGDLLLASKDRGILKWNGKNYETAFPKNQTTGILYKFETYKDELWILGEDAIFCYKDTKLITYNNQVGINAENMRGLYVSEKTVYASNGNAVIQFLKSNAVGNIAQPSFALGKVINENAGKIIKENSSLPYNENFISFQFSLIAYANAVNTHIAYSINNKDIVHLPSDRREINLDFLKPQNYTVEFYIVSNGITSLKPISKFSFSIAPPFYNTWWFYALCAIIAVSVIYFIVTRRIKKERAALALKESKLLLEQELDKSTLSGIKAQMNPHFIFNALNTIQSYVYMNDKKKAGSYISKFSDLTRSILEMSNKENITLGEEINSLQLYLSLEKMRFEDSFDYGITTADNVNKDKITMPSMLLQPYVENAIKHGLLHRKTNRQLQIFFTLQNGYLKVVIDDNGIGRKRSMELNTINAKNHNSFAMGANKKRLDILKQQHSNIALEIIDKYSDQGEVLGTQIVILLPLKDEWHF